MRERFDAGDLPIARVPVEEHPSDPAALAYLALFRANGQQPINLNLVYALSPKLGRARSMMAHAIRYDSLVPRPFRELTILRTAQLMGGDYEVHQHETAALRCGYSQSQLDALADWRPSNLFSEKERALLAYVDQAVLAKGEVNETIFAELALFFSAREIVEITIIAANYMGTAVLTNALRVRIDEPGVFAAIIP